MKTKPQTMISVPKELLRLLLPDEQINALLAFARSVAAVPSEATVILPAKKSHGNAGKKRAARRSTKDWIDLLATRKVSESRGAFAKRIGTSEAYVYQLSTKFPEVKRMPAWNDR